MEIFCKIFPLKFYKGITLIIDRTSNRIFIKEFPLNSIWVHFIKNSLWFFLQENSFYFFLTSLEKKIRELPLNLIYVHFISNSNGKFLQENPLYFFSNFKLEIGFFSTIFEQNQKTRKLRKFISFKLQLS